MSHEDPKVYDLDQLTVNFCGLPIEAGFGDGAAVKIEQVEPDFTIVVGADGSIARSKTNKRHTKVTISLLGTSAGNAKLSALNNIDRATSNGGAIGPMLIRDRQGLSIFAGTHAWIVKPPDVEYGAETTNRDWEIMCANPSRFDGGN